MPLAAVGGVHDEVHVAVVDLGETEKFGTGRGAQGELSVSVGGAGGDERRLDHVAHAEGEGGGPGPHLDWPGDRLTSPVMDPAGDEYWMNRRLGLGGCRKAGHESEAERKGDETGGTHAGSSWRRAGMGLRGRKRTKRTNVTAVRCE